MKENGGVFTYGFAIDSETLQKIEKLSKALNLRSKSAVVRFAVTRLYEEEILRR